jgi:hypothetical protein
MGLLDGVGDVFEDARDFVRDDIYQPVEDWVDSNFNNPFQIDFPEQEQYQDPSMPAGSEMGSTVLDQLLNRRNRAGNAPEPGGGALRYKTLLGQ